MSYPRLRAHPTAVVIAAVVAAASPAAAEPITGTVLDGASFEPVAGATVSIAGNPVESVTDARGRFSLADVAPDAVLVVEAEGFETSTQDLATLAAETDAGLTILIFRPGQVSETIIVSEAAPRIQTAPGETQLDRTELTTMPGARGDALTVVKSLPGVANADAAGPGPSLLVIRGAAPEDSKVLLDGIEIPLLYHFFGLQSVVPSEFIEDIEFLPGGFDPSEGRATGGIINIETRDSYPEELGGFAELSFINVAGYLEGPLWKRKRLTFAAAFRRSAIDVLLPAVIPDSANLSFTTAPQYYDGQLRVDWRPPGAHRVTVFAFLSYDLLSLLVDRENPNDPLLTGKFDNETTFSRLMTTWRYARGPLSSRVTGMVGLGGFRVEVGEDRFLDGDAMQSGARADVQWTVADRLTLRTGADLTVDRFDFRSKFPLPPQEGSGQSPSFSTLPVVEVDETWSEVDVSGYAVADFEPVETLRISPGVRVDYYDRIGETTVSPRVSVQYDVDDRWTARGALGSYSRPLEQAESISTTLEPELATQYVAGVDYRVRDGIEASGSTFYTDRRQLVVQDPTLSQTDPRNAYVNRGYGSSYGLEGIVRAKSDRFFGWVAYTLSRSTRIDGPRTDERLFDYDQTHNLLVVGSYQWGKWTFGGRFQVTTGVPTTPVMGSIYISDLNAYTPIYGDINSDRLETSHQLDVRVDRKWKFHSWELSAYLDITNVYANARTLGYSYNFDYSERMAISSIPILPALGIRGTF